MSTKTWEQYNPTDVADAREQWRANCGPAALAASIGLELKKVRAAFAPVDGFPGFTNQTLMQVAIKALRLVPSKTRVQLLRDDQQRQYLPPSHGVSHLQLSGGWWDLASVQQQYKFTHWVATHTEVNGNLVIYDINAGEWLPVNRWKDEIKPQLLANAGADEMWCRGAFNLHTDRRRAVWSDRQHWLAQLKKGK